MDMQHTIWERANCTWRAAAVVGLITGIASAAVLSYSWLTEAPSHFWTTNVWIAIVVPIGIAVSVASCWLSMVRSGKAAILWLVFWLGGAPPFLVADLSPRKGPIFGDAPPLGIALALLALILSQVWVAEKVVRVRLMEGTAPREWYPITNSIAVWLIRLVIGVMVILGLLYIYKS